jgi:Protein of unknown function (DUF433)
VVVSRPSFRQGTLGVITADQLELISTDPGVMHGQAVIAETHVPVSVILHCLATCMAIEELVRALQMGQRLASFSIAVA